MFSNKFKAYITDKTEDITTKQEYITPKRKYIMSYIAYIQEVSCKTYWDLNVAFPQVSMNGNWLMFPLYCYTDNTIIVEEIQ